MARAVYDFQSLNKKTAIGKRRETMSKEITQFDDAMYESKLDAMIRTKVEDIVNAMLDAEADEIANAGRYERKTGRKAFRAGRYERGPTAKVGRLGLKVPELKGALFESAVIERHRRRESGVEEAPMETYLAGVSARRVDDAGQPPWGDRICLRGRFPTSPSMCMPRSMGGGNARWRADGRTCSWTACGAGVPGAGAWRT